MVMTWFFRLLNAHNANLGEFHTLDAAIQALRDDFGERSDYDGRVLTQRIFTMDEQARPLLLDDARRSNVVDRYDRWYGTSLNILGTGAQYTIQRVERCPMYWGELTIDIEEMVEIVNDLNRLMQHIPPQNRERVPELLESMTFKRLGLGGPEWPIYVWRAVLPDDVLVALTVMIEFAQQRVESE